MSKFLYAEQVFNADNNEKAQLISLPPAAGLDSRGRALKESMPTLDLLNRCIEIKPGDLIIDFGCGYGRLSKLLIERFGAFVIGVDLSGSMRNTASKFISDDRFSVVSQKVFKKLVSEQMISARLALCCYTLSLVAMPKQDILSLYSSVKNGLFVLDFKARSIPAIEILDGHSNPQPQVKLLNDGFDVQGFAASIFDEVSSVELDKNIFALSDSMYSCFFKKNEV